MSRSIFPWLVTCGLLWLTCGHLIAAPPNVIVIYTDDHGHADLGAQGVVDDIRTPHTDALARSGVRMVHGYSTAPQCVPSRAGLLAGRFQSRFGLEDNNASLAGFDRERTLPKRLSEAGYATAQFGKWHLGPPDRITDHGFRHFFAQNANRPFQANITLTADDRPTGLLDNELYHVDGCSQAAAATIRRYRDVPFFLYVAYRAPHVPLDAPPKYLRRFPGKMPERRRQALAMLSAVDDGVGQITRTLSELGLTERTLLFYISDNGAPLKIHRSDDPGGGPGWDGSLNDPLNGEKGMLAEGGIHVPYVVAWPGTIPAGQEYAHPVSTLDVAATVTTSAGIPAAPGELDGVNLVPHLTGQNPAPPHEWLAWRWNAQSAIRKGNWKLLRGGDREYLYQLSEDLEEQHNRLADHPEIAQRLRQLLVQWTGELKPPGLAVAPMSAVWNQYFDHYLEGKTIPPPAGGIEKNVSAVRDPGPAQSWVARGGSLRSVDGVLLFRPAAAATGATGAASAASAGTDATAPRAFITRSGLDIAGPVRVRVKLATAKGGPARIAWRIAGDKDFRPEQAVDFEIAEPSEPDQPQDVTVDLPGNDRVIHVRVHLPNRPVDILAITVETIPPADAPAAPADPGTLPPQQNPDAAPEDCAGTAVGQATEPAKPTEPAQAAAPSVASSAVPTRPLNVVLILADDLGWSDTSLMGTSRLHATPNLRRLAERGMLFTNAYAASPLCSPTRASILTGQNPARIGITAPNCHLPMVRLKPSVRDNSAPNSATLTVDSATRLDAKRVSLATRLSDAGYATGHFGKWHLGHAPYTPLEHGFDVDIPNHPGPGPAGSFLAPWKFRDFTERTPGEHIEDRMGDEAVAWIERHQDQPFFLNYWQFSVHAPFDAKPDLIEAYRSRIDPQDEQQSPTYAAMVHSLDDNVGKLLDALDRMGLTDQTAVIFYSDNGGNMYDQVDGTTPTSNRPLRGGKATLYEGGIRVPAIFAWPGVTTPASRCETRIQSTDLYPTVLQLLGLDPTPDHPIDGIDITPALRGQPLDRGPMFTYFPHQVQVPDNLPPAVAVHRDQWKLIRLFHAGNEPASDERTTHEQPANAPPSREPSSRPHAYRLYHLKDDIGERHDRSAEHPELVRELDGLIDRFLEETAAVVPLPNPRFDPTAPPPPPRTRRPAASNPTPSRPAPPRKIGRWNVSGDTSLERVGETLKLISKGGDPWIATTDLPKDLRGPFRVQLRLRSTAAGPAMLYYRTTEHPQFHRDQTVRIDLRHDGTWQDHEIQLPLPDLQAIRLDPATAAGEVQIQKFQLIDNNNNPHSLLR